MRLLLVRPWVNKNITTVKNFLFGEPLGLECVAAVMKELGHDVLLVDFMIEKDGSLKGYLDSFKPDAVGVTSQCTDVDNVLRIAKETKDFDEGIKVIVGGVQATCFPDSFFKEEVDYVFRTTTRENVKMLLEEIQGTSVPGVIEGIYSKRENFSNAMPFHHNEYIVPDRSTTERYREKYQYIGFQPCAVVQTAYGCRNKCSFCIRWKLEGALLREIDIEKIVDQMQALKEPYIMICDNDFLINGERLQEFCRLVKERGIKKKYMCYGSVNSILEKPELLKTLNECGLMSVIVGYEAFDDSRLQEYNKAATIDENKKATELLKENGIACWGSFIIHPDWDKNDFVALRKYVRKLKPELVTFSPLVPHPMTDLYRQYEDRLIYPVSDYEKWNFGDVLIYPSKMTLNRYYRQVLKLALLVNFTGTAINYTRRNVPLKNSVRMVLGFKALFGVYVRNIAGRKGDR